MPWKWLQWSFFRAFDCSRDVSTNHSLFQNCLRNCNVFIAFTSTQLIQSEIEKGSSLIHYQITHIYLYLNHRIRSSTIHIPNSHFVLRKQPISASSERERKEKVVQPKRNLCARGKSETAFNFLSKVHS